MKAPGPPPTMPRRKRRLWLRGEGSTAIGVFLSISWKILEAEHSAVRLSIGARLCKIVECSFCYLNNMIRDEWSAFLGALVTAFYTALPFQHRPSWEIVLRQFGEDAPK